MYRGGVSIGRLAQSLIIGVACFAIYGSLIGTAKNLAPPDFELPVMIALTVAVLWLPLLFHELGHAAIALLIGRRVHFIMVWPLSYSVRARKFAFSLRGNQGYGGFVMATPELWGDWRRGETALLLGGILANLLTAVLGYAVIGLGLLGSSAAEILAAFSFLSFAVALANLVPSWTLGSRGSDGARLFDKVRGRKESQAERTGWLQAMHVDGVPPEKWDPELIRQIEEDVARRTAPQVAYSLLYQRYMALSEFARARTFVDLQLSRFGKVPDWIRIEQAFFLGHLDKNGPDALRILDLVPRRMRSSYFYWRAMAMARIANGDGSGALGALREARILANRQPSLWKNADETVLMDQAEKVARKLESGH